MSKTLKAAADRAVAFARNWKVTALQGVVAVAMIWLGLAMLSAPGRVCEPVLSARCRAHAWNFIGDLVWLRSLKQWETLSTGALAVVAALIGGWFLNRQMQQADVHERKRWRRKMASARSELPRALNELTRYLEEMARTLSKLHAQCSGGVLREGAVIPTFSLPPMSAEATLTRMVEASPEDVGLLFGHLRSMLQVLSARLEMLHEAARPSARGTNAIEERIVDVIEIHAHCLGLFPFARPDTKELPTSGACADLLRSMSVCGFRCELFPELGRKVTDRNLRKLGDAGRAIDAA